MMHSHTYIYDKAVPFIFTQLEPSKIISAKKGAIFLLHLNIISINVLTDMKL